jgi:hypothetical protein
VETVLVIVFASPGARSSWTSAGSTPGAADAMPVVLTITVLMATMHRAALNLRVMFTVSFLLAWPYAAPNSVVSHAITRR